MKLTDADKKTFSDWVQDKCGAQRCTRCGNAQWAVNDSSNLSLGYDLHSTRFHYHEGTLHLSLICTTCGHMVFFNPGVMGFKPDVPQAHDVTPETQGDSTSSE